MSNKIRNFWEEVEKETQPETNRIKAYWDKKTLFVHRRALWIGVVLGFILGLDFGFAVWYLLK